MLSAAFCPRGARLFWALVFVLAAPHSGSAQTTATIHPLTSRVIDWSSLTSHQVIVLGPSQTSRIEQTQPSSSPTLLLLQVSFGALQAMDVFATTRGINAGHSEANPLMRSLAGHPAALLTAKAGAGAVTILLSKRMARKNRMATIVTMTAINSLYSVVVARNLRAVNQRR